MTAGDLASAEIPRQVEPAIAKPDMWKPTSPLEAKITPKLPLEPEVSPELIKPKIPTAPQVSPEPLTPVEPGPSQPQSPPQNPAEPQPSGRAVPGSFGSLMGRTLPPAPVIPAETAGKKRNDTFEPAEVVVVSPDMALAQSLAQKVATMGFSPKRRRRLSAVGLVLTTLRVPQGMGVEQALETLRSALPEVWFDANHRYELSGVDSKDYAAPMMRWSRRSPQCGPGTAIGFIDTGVDKKHPTLNKARVVTRSFLSSGIEPASREHGTAVIALVVGAAASDVHGVMPDAEVSLAAVFRKRGRGKVDTTAELVIYALDWLVEKKVSAINLSFGGPRNLALEAALHRVAAAGIPVVAAAGNGGGDAMPVYPAAQKEVIAVTAVDAKQRPYSAANRGDYIAFAAPGVDIWSAKSGGGGKYFSGTSYATPFVTATIAATRTVTKTTARAVVKDLQTHSLDLGEPGRDRVYGWGLIQAPLHCRKH